MQYCYLLLYIFLNSISVIKLFATLGLEVQRGSFDELFRVNGFGATVLIIMFFFYITAIYITFGAYKEFKALFYE